jgi:hypothetical protein
MSAFCTNLNYIKININFLHGDEYFEYLLRNHGYLGEKMFIMKKIGRCEIGLNVDQDAIRTYNKMHVKYIVRVKWEIGELKRKWRQLMKRFDSTKPKCIVLFKAVVILINFLHRCQMDFKFKVINEQLPNPVDHGWDKKIKPTGVKST